MEPKLIFDAPILNQKKIWVKKQYIPYFDHPFHYHLVSEITWIKKGHGKIVMGDYVGNFTSDEIIFEIEDLPHLWRSAPEFHKEKDPVGTQAIEIYFHSSLIPQMTDNGECLKLYKNFLTKARRGIRIKGKARVDIIRLMKKVIESDQFERLAYFLQIIQIIITTKEIECLASINYKGTKDDLDLERFDKIYKYLLDNFSKDIKLEEVAEMCYLTPNSFCRFFKSKTQKTFIQFLNEIRVGHACKLLQTEDDSVVNIGYRSGYNSPVNFFKFFKQITATTPKEYRDKFIFLSQNV